MMQKPATTGSLAATTTILFTGETGGSTAHAVGSDSVADEAIDYPDLPSN